jgi:hypothetical protein
MKNTSIYFTFICISVLLIIASSCKKEFDAPPAKTIPVGQVSTIAELRAMYTGSTITFAEDRSVYATVTMDEKNGNLYKNIYVQDPTGAINLRLLNSGGLYQGDSIRIYLKGTTLSKYNGMMQLDSVNTDLHIIKQKTLVNVSPTVVTIDQLNTSLQSMLVKLENVEFKTSELGTTYADAVNQQTKNKTLVDCNGKEVIVRTSGYANFASQKLAEGNGSIVAVVGEFNGTIQLYIRSVSEIIMNNARCSGIPDYLRKDFEDNSSSSGGWTIQNVTGSVNWSVNSVGANSGSYYGQCSNYIGGSNQACETWYISPSVDISGSTNPVFTFLNAYKYTGSPMEVYVSTDYSSGLPSTGTWTKLTFTASSGNFAWVNSGNIDFSTYKSSNVHVAFKYIGSSSNGSTWEIDDIIIKEN